MTDPAQSNRLIILCAGIVIAAVLVLLGVMVDRRRRYHLIAGYNRAPEEVKKLYDIEGLAKHIGGGLITLGVLLAAAAIVLYCGLQKWFAGAMGLFLFVVFIMLVGARKFMPARQLLAARSPADAGHPFLRWILSEKAYKAVEKGTRQWYQECRTCGHRQDFWEAGGVRYKAAGKPTKLQLCEKCQKVRWHKIRKKTER